MTAFMRLLAAAVVAILLNLSAALAASSPSEEVDLIADRPSLATTFIDTASKSLASAWDVATGVMSTVLPPSPSSLSNSAAKEDQKELVTLLGYAGYKLKEIDSQVGIIPTIAFKFALTRELSESDRDYLDYRLELSRFRTPGLSASVQRAIVDTVLAINTGGAYHVSELKVQILPLPKVAFSVTPKATALGEESSSLMRAIQKMEKRLRGDIATVGGKVLPHGMMKRWLKSRDWLIGAAILLLALSTLVEIRRQLRPDRLGRSGPWVTLVLLGLGSVSWVGYAMLPLSLITLGAGIAIFGLTALVAAGGKGAIEPMPLSVAEAAPQVKERELVIEPSIA